MPPPRTRVTGHADPRFRVTNAETIVAVSSGSPPAAIAVLRVSGPAALDVARQLTGKPLPPARSATLRELRDGRGEILDRAILLVFPGPRSATGEDLVELHCHGGRAVVAAVERAVLAQPRVRRAAPGEFTRRAFVNGRIDLGQAEGLADLLMAETELQRQAALSLTEGRFSAQVEQWRTAVLNLAAQVEAVLDFADEEDGEALHAGWVENVRRLTGEIRDWLARPRTERLRDGVRVVLAGPPNSGKSTLFNALLDEDAAIVSEQAGTTRDVLERSVALGGVPLVLVDTAGIRDDAGDPLEREGIARTRQRLSRADVVLWLGPEGEGPAGALEVEAQIDRAEATRKRAPWHRLSARTGEGMQSFVSKLREHAGGLLPQPGSFGVNERQARLLSGAVDALSDAEQAQDELVIAEHLRQARLAFDQLLGSAATEDMLDALFARFCIGK
ncbi:tRNA uridine-5-carboxymethylaminomethyl(34) synthesis GTPase MnmE [Erythrobacteraceae bacterium CFH 75059]|nr:tRNA uridine-5-carboxymethylaminomethyl(34) synthesis GTPase MnmE [Erythrobacteraceae bacterium CFH 75059]